MNNKVVSDLALTHLNNLNISYEVVVHPENVSTAKEFSEKSGIPINQIFKTMVLCKKGEHLLVSLPTACRINFKKLQQVLGKGWKVAKPNTIKEVCGYQPYCVTPFGAMDSLPYYADNSMFENEFVYLGSGKHGSDIKVLSKEVLEKLNPICIDVID